MTATVLIDASSYALFFFKVLLMLGTLHQDYYRLGVILSRVTATSLGEQLTKTVIERVSVYS